MFLDASAIVAILGREPGHEEIEKRLPQDADDATLYISPLVRFEAAVALARLKSEQAERNTKPTPSLLRQAAEAVSIFVEDLGIKEISISAEIGRKALEASASYGKAVGHPADLNFGDCFVYACAKALDTVLLYKGNDFAKTDLA
jgi:ribonuclease VapC